MSLPAPFARLEARMNAAVMNRISNAVAILAGVEVRGIFSDPRARGDVGLLGMVDSRPVFELLTADIPMSVLQHFGPAAATDAYLLIDSPDAADLRLVVHGSAYQVVEHQPDGTGMSRLMLTWEAQS